MRHNVFISLTLLVLFVLLLYVLHFEQLSSRISKIKQSYQKRVLEVARSVSLSYFHRDRVYSFVVLNRLEELNVWLEQVKIYYPYIEKIDILDIDQIDFDLFKISPSGTKIHVFTRIFNGDASLCVPDKVAFFTLNAQSILDEVDPSGFLKIVDVGIDFVFGLKYQFVKPILLWVFYIALLVGGTAVFILFLYLHTRYNLRSRTLTLQRESTLRRINEAIVEMTNIFLQNELKEDIYTIILEKAVMVIPNAQAGSVILKKDGHYVYVAAIGYDLRELSKIKFSCEHVREWVKGGCSIKKKSEVIDLNQNKIDQEDFKLLRKAGRLDEIMCSLNCAVEIEGEIALQLNLDNFETEDAFDEESVKLAQLFANQLGIFLYKRKFYEQIIKQQNALEYMSYHDHLTMLLNRTALEEFSEKIFHLARREQKEVSVIFLDLSKFKQVNDRYGHSTGDRVLRIIGERLEKAVRENDLVARFGGDEFIIVSYGLCGNDLNSFLNRILEVIRSPIKLENKTLQIDVQIGVAIFPKDGKTLDELIRKADIAMYRAKQRKTSVVFYNDEKIDST